MVSRTDLGRAAPWLVQRKSEMTRHSLKGLQVVPRRRRFPGLDGTGSQRQLRVGDDEVRIEELDDADPAASIAPSG